MTTATTTTPVSQASDAAFRVWVAEIITTFTTLGLTQTADTGQINVVTVTRAAINTAAGYTIWSFNDTLQATASVFLKLEFGSGAATTDPQMWVTIGTGSDGAGNLTGTVGTRRMTCSGAVPNSLTANYTSYFVYNTTYGVLGLAWKVNAQGTANPFSALGGFYIFRSNDATGAASAVAVSSITNSTNATTASSAAAASTFMESISYLTAIAYGPSTFWTANLFGGLSNFGVSGVSASLFPVFYRTPALAVSAYCAMAIYADLGFGATASVALIGSTALTFIALGGAFGCSFFAANVSGGFLATASAAGNGGILFLWE